MNYLRRRRMRLMMNRRFRGFLKKSYMKESQNLFDINLSPKHNDVAYTKNIIDYTVTDDTVTFNCITGVIVGICYRVPVEKNTQYTLAISNIVGVDSLRINNTTNPDTASYGYVNNSNKAATFTPNESYIYLTMYLSYGNKTQGSITRPQLVKGPASTMPAYTPYQNPKYHGYPLQLPNANPEKLAKVSISGNTTVTGTPSIENPATITSVGDYNEETGKYDIKIGASSNLFKMMEYYIQPGTTLSGVTITKTNDNGYELNGTCTKSNNFTEYMIIEPGTYTLAIRSTDNIMQSPESILIQVYGANVINKAILNGKAKNHSTTFTVDTAGSVMCRIRIEKGNTYTNFKLYPQLLKGSYTTDTLPDYEPYHSSESFTLSLEKPLHKINSYADSIELNIDNRVAKLNNEVLSFDVDGKNVYVAGSSTIETNTVKIGLRYWNIKHSASLIGICNYLPLSANWNTDTQSFWGHTDGTDNTNTIYYFRFPKKLFNLDGTETTEQVAEKINLWLQSLDDKLTVYYKLNTPASTDISDQIDWSSIPPLWKGNITISADTTVRPSDMQVTYYTSDHFSDYQEVEYIESTGTQYIDTGYIPNGNLDIKLKYRLTKIPATIAENVCLLGSYKTNEVLAIRYYSQGWYFYYGNSIYENARGIESIDLLTHTMDINKNILYIDNNNIVEVPAATFTGYSLTLFGQHNSASVGRLSSARIYSMSIKESDVLVCDFVPCYHKVSGEIGLYDKVNNRFYKNEGDGTFLKGIDIED